MIVGRGWKGWLAVLLVAWGTTAAAADRDGGEAVPGFEGLAVADGAELEAARGADGDLVIVSSQQNMNAHVEGASFTADVIANGPIHLGNGAFDGYSGVGINTLNTGNNNAFAIGITAIFNLH